MRVLVAGSSGLIGTALRLRLRERGHDVVRLLRRGIAEAGGTTHERRWHPPSGRIADDAFDGVDAVVNLCGAPLVSRRWSAARKQVLHDSRVEPTEVLAEAVAERGVPVLLNASGVNYYGDTGHELVDESAPAGSGFLPHLCSEWESATSAASVAGTRVVFLRLAPVLARESSLAKVLRPVFRSGLGARLGSGGQWLPWVSLADAVEAAVFCLDRDDVSGPVNVTAPEPATNAEFTRAVARALRRPAPWRVPAAALRLALGEAAEEMLLTGSGAVPSALLRAGFRHADTDLDAALATAL